MRDGNHVSVLSVNEMKDATDDISLLFFSWYLTFLFVPIYFYSLW